MAQPTASSSASERRQSVRTGVVWDGVRRLLESGDATDGQQARIVDIGGGTGGFAVPLAELGHTVQVIDPSPDALASLDRRARERGVADRVTGQQGDLSDLPDLVDEADLVLCHGVLEMVDDPAASLASIADVLRPGGHLSLLVAQRHAAVVARAMAGHFQAARELLDDAPDGSAGHASGGRSGAAGAASPTTRSSTSWPAPACTPSRSTPSGSSPTWCRAASSTSSPARRRRWSSSSRPWPPAPSTSRSLPSCTSSRAADRRPGGGGR